MSGPAAAGESPAVPVDPQRMARIPLPESDRLVPGRMLPMVVGGTQAGFKPAPTSFGGTSHAAGIGRV